MHSDKDNIDVAVQLLENCLSEPDKQSPAVSAILVLNGQVIGHAHRGELGPGEHAEYTLLEKKLKDVDVEGATLFTTLEPCTTRNHPKVPCADRIIERKIGQVVIGILDPNPSIYGKGSKKLKESGIAVRHFPPESRKLIEEKNSTFINQYQANAASQGRVRFDYSKHNGVYSLGQDGYTFTTKWSKHSNRGIYALGETPALAVDAKEFKDVTDASIYDASSRHVTVRTGELLVLRNSNQYFCLLKIIKIYDNTRPPDDRDELVFDYRILTDKTTDFSKED
ncbi:MAG: deaminase [Candidatus Obscuribacterales bacterium]